MPRAAGEIELEGAVGGVGDDGDRRGRGSLGQGRITGAGDQLKAGKIQRKRRHHAEQEHGLAADLVGKMGEEHIKRRRQEDDRDLQHVHGLGIDLEGPLQIELRVEKAGVPNHALRHHDAKQRQQHNFEIAPFEKTLGISALGGAAFGLELPEGWALFQLQPNPNRNRQESDRHQKRHAPTPSLEGFLANGRAHAEHNH